MKSPIITLTTDFGTRDGYVGQMKGVILTICPECRVIDITHEIEPFSIIHGALVINALKEYFPPETVHVAVIDPGVGGTRRCIALKTKYGWFVGPDNGVFTFLLADSENYVMREITNPELMAVSPQPTFHGRDIFAYSAAKLAAGFPEESIGPVVTNPVTLPIQKPQLVGKELQGSIVYTDRFGNLMTNIQSADIEHIGKIKEIRVGLTRVASLSKSYIDVEKDEVLALINSFGFLEIAIRENSAARLLKHDDKVKIILE